MLMCLLVHSHFIPFLGGPNLVREDAKFDAIWCEKFRPKSYFDNYYLAQKIKKKIQMP